MVNHAGHNLISGLFRGGESSGAVCPSRGPPQAFYSSTAGHRITPHNLKSPLYIPLSTYILVEHLPPHYAQSLDWIRGHDMPRLWHPTLTCSTVDTNRRSCYIRVLACATPTCISTQTRAAWSSGAALAALCCKTPCSHPPSLLNPPPVCTHSSSPVKGTSRDIQHHRGSSI